MKHECTQGWKGGQVAYTLSTGKIEVVVLPEPGMVVEMATKAGGGTPLIAGGIEPALIAGRIRPDGDGIFRYRLGGRQVEFEAGLPEVDTNAMGAAVVGGLGSPTWLRSLKHGHDDHQAWVTAALDITAHPVLCRYLGGTLQISHVLSGQVLTTRTVLHVPAGMVMPAAIGWCVPLCAGGERTDWTVELPPTRRRMLQDQRTKLPVGGRFAVSPGRRVKSQLGGLDWNATYPVRAPLTCRLSGGGSSVAVTIGAGYTHAEVDAPAAEPDMVMRATVGAENDIKSWRGLPVASPGAPWTGTIGVSFE